MHTPDTFSSSVFHLLCKHTLPTAFAQACYKNKQTKRVKKQIVKPRLASCECTVLDSKEMTKEIDQKVKQPSQVACISEDLMCQAA